MNFEICDIGGLYIVGEDGGTTKLMDLTSEPTIKPCFEVSKHAADSIVLSGEGSGIITGTLKYGKFLRCGSRKRLIKLLMSIGISRNSAVSFAAKARSRGAPYEAYWRYCWFSGDPYSYLYWRKK